MKNLEKTKNEAFLAENIIFTDKFEWSSLSPYDTFINGKKRSFINSYIAHIAKHPKNFLEKDIWKKFLDDYPKNIEKTYLEYSNYVIKKEKTNNGSLEYDEKNNAINITNSDGIRVSLKRSFYDKNKIVISTCHPRRKKRKRFSNNHNYSMMFFNNFHFSIKRKEIQILESIFNSNGNIDNFDNKEVDKLIEKYLDEIYGEINKLEYYKKKCTKEQGYYYELTDAFDYEEIIGYIDKLLLCYRYLIKKNPDDIYLYVDLLDRFKKIDSFNNINNYIENNDNESLSYFKNSLDRSYMYYTTHISEKKEHIIQLIEELMDKYNLKVKDARVVRLDDPENHLSGYAIRSDTFSNARSRKKNETLTPVQILTFLKGNNIKWEDAKVLLRYCISDCSPELFDEIRNRWDEPYTDNELRKLIDEYRNFTEIE